MNKLLRRTKNKKGFTLIELLVVLAILAVIALIAVPNFIGVRDSAVVSADEQTVELVQSAMELMVVSENLKYVNGADELCTLDSSGVKEITGGAKVASVDTAMLEQYVDGKSGLQKSGTTYTFKITTGGGVTH